MRAIKATIELKKSQGQDTNTPVDPEKCTITEEHLQNAFSEVSSKVRGERVLHSNSTAKRLYSFPSDSKKDTDAFELD